MSSNRYTLGELAPAHTFEQPRRSNRFLRVCFIFLMLAAASVGSCVTIGYHLTHRDHGPIEQDSTLVLELKASMDLVHEAELSDWITSERPLSVDAFRRALEMAATDERINEVLVVIDRLSIGFGTAEALREIIFEFRAGPKPVHVLIEADAAGELELYLAAAGTSVTMSPQTTVSFDGLSADLSFFGGTLGKLGVPSDLVSSTPFGRAMESWTGHEMSEDMKQSIDALLAATWKNVVEGIARDRRLKEAELRAFSQRGLGTAQDAVELGLVDTLGYRDQLLAQHAGPQLLAQHYLQSTQVELRGLDAESGQAKIALIAASGDIVVDSEPAPLSAPLISGRALAQTIRKAAQDEDVSAILLWVESSGGSMVGADLVWREIERVRDIAQKPVVVSMASVAASGGYWISVGADAIVAAPSTVTGSIGVIYGQMRMQEFLTRLGMRKEGEQAMGSYERLGTQQRLVMEGIISHGYQQFVKKVAKGRERSVQEIEAVARGRVWTGEDAKAHGLVDRVGGILSAVEVCKEKLGLPADARVKLWNYPRRGLWQRLRDAASQLGLGRVVKRGPMGLFKKVKGELAQVGDPRAWARAPEFKLR